MDQNSKILQNSSKLVVARDEATKEIVHEHIIFPREDRGFRNDDEDIEVYFFRFFHDVDAHRGTRNMFEILNS